MNTVRKHDAFSTEIVAVMHGQPSLVVDVAEIERAAVPAAVGDASVRRIVLTMTPPRIVAGEMNAFLDHNPNALLLDVGRLSEAGLKESWLTARAATSEDPSIWRKFAKIVRSATQTGVTAVNPETGATVKMREHRFTPGAERLERAGILMLPVAGVARLKFGKSS